MWEKNRLIMRSCAKHLHLNVYAVCFLSEMLNQTFELLGFKVLFHPLLGLKEIRKVLEDLTRNSKLEKFNRFFCCLISRGTDTHLLATDSNGLGIRLEDLRLLFSPDHCPSLGGKPKLFFNQIYRTTEAPSMYDEYLETDGPKCQYAGKTTLPVSADILWSVCTAEEKLLEDSGHQSVYLHALHTALLKGHERYFMNLLPAVLKTVSLFSPLLLVTRHLTLQ